MTVLCFNAQSLCNKLHEFQDLLSGISGNCYDVICVTETWFTDQLLDQTIISNHLYNVYRCDRKDRKGGGCAIFVNNKFKVRQITFPQIISLLDVQAVCVEIHINSQTYAICCIYNPRGDVKQYLLEIIEIFKFTCNTYSSAILLRDFNLKNFAENLFGNMEARYSQFANVVSQYGLEQLVTKPTRHNNILDLVFCSSYLSYSDVKVFAPFSNADHNNLTFTLFIDKLAAVNDVNVHWVYHKCDFMNFNNYLSSLNWYAMFECCKNVN